MIVSIRMTQEEKELANAYAKLSGVSLSEAIKRAFFDKIEEEYDAWRLENVETRNGTRYMVVICLYSVNKDEPDKKGLIAIQIFTEAESSSKQKELYTIAGDI